MSTGTSSATGPSGGPSGSALAEVSYLTGVGQDGVVTNASYWGANAETAHKWGSGALGSPGGTVTFYFDPASNFSAVEQTTFRESFALWSAVANIQFTETASASGASVDLRRGADKNAYESDAALTVGSGTTLGSHRGQSLISIDTSVAGFDLSGSFSKVGGYGLGTVIHEIGHLLGLGHGGHYDGSVNAATDQNSPYDDHLWTTMSYISWTDTNAKYLASEPVTGTNWGMSPDGYYRQSSGTVMPLDILGAEQLYGAPASTPLSGGQVFGFHTNLSGLLKPFFDFTVDTAPIVTLFDLGHGNTLDLSGFSQNAVISLTAGTFSSAGGLTNNIAIAFGTVIETAIGGSGNDTIIGTTGNDIITGGPGADTLTGNGGADIFRDTAVNLNSDTITDFSALDTINIVNTTVSNFYYSFANHILNYNIGSSANYSVMLPSLGAAAFTVTADMVSGIDVQVAPADNATFAFKFTDASIIERGASVTVVHPDGTQTILTNATHFTFVDGTITEHPGPVDDLYYYAHNPDVWNAHVDATTHYHNSGWHEGRDPNGYFSTSGYLGVNADVAALKTDPLANYDQYGWKEGRDPNANFSTSLYLQHNPDVKAAGIDPLQHFLQYGQAEGRQTYAAIGPSLSFNHGSFDPEYYLLSNADVAKAALASGGNTAEFAYRHYETYGWHDGRNPNAFFDVKAYLAAYTDVAAAHIDPLTHYDQYGWHEGRNASASFNTNAYEAANPDVANAHIDPLTHYLQFGAHEGRAA